MAIFLRETGFGDMGFGEMGFGEMGRHRYTKCCTFYAFSICLTGLRFRPNRTHCKDVAYCFRCRT